MFGFGKQKSPPGPSEADGEASASGRVDRAESSTDEQKGRLAGAIARAAQRGKPSSKMFSRLKKAVAKTSAVLNADINDLVVGRSEIDEDLLEELEILLVSTDVGVTATQRIIRSLRYGIERHQASDADAFLIAVRKELHALLIRNDQPVRQAAPGRPQVILMVGVNGVGKTTTIGKLTKQLQAEGNSVMLAAGDTFRAAAVEQLQVWGERNDVPVIAQQSGADPASVIYDALEAATAKGVDVLIADTAGRLHTKANLMEELKKVVRVMKKVDPDAPHEVMLVIDATTGQNAVYQAEKFHQAVPLTGITMTKLDGTAKGGILFAISEALDIPFRFIGIGEQVEDLRHFDPDEFLNALLGS